VQVADRTYVSEKLNRAAKANAEFSAFADFSALLKDRDGFG
jgi:hypothetical protein